MSKRSIIGRYLVVFPLFIGVMLVSQHDLVAFQFKEQLQNQSTRTFRHWNTQKKQVTGYTRLSYSSMPDSGDLLEISKNMDAEQQVYSEKTLRFDLASGKLLRYEESDFRANIKTINTFSPEQIHTEIWKKEDKTVFDVKITPDLVPFEVLAYYLRSKLPEIQDRQSIKFVLYLPVIALELSEKGLPLSLSQLEMKASVAGVQTENTILGKKQSIKIRVTPTSFLIKALLPSDKSTFDFTFINQHPFMLLAFEEGKTITALETID